MSRETDDEATKRRKRRLGVILAALMYSGIAYYFVFHFEAAMDRRTGPYGLGYLILAPIYAGYSTWKRWRDQRP